MNLKLMKLKTCLYTLKKWISENFLLVNLDKTEILVIDPAWQGYHFDQETITLDNRYFSNFNCQDTLSFDQQIKEITMITFYHLHNRAEIRTFLSTADAVILIDAFVSSRMDYGIALFSGLPCESTKSLQIVQNATASILTRTIWIMKLILALLHWLLIHTRSDFKVLLMTHKTVHSGWAV